MRLCWERGVAGWLWGFGYPQVQSPVPEMSSDEPEWEPGWERIQPSSGPLPERGDVWEKVSFGLVHGRSHEHGFCAKNDTLG